jgi:hypothetical protein
MAVAAIPYVNSPGLRAPNNAIFTNAANAYLTALKKKTVAPPPTVAAPSAAPSTAPAIPPPVSGHWDVPDYQSLIASMPDFVAANANLTAQGGDAESARRASIQRAIIDSGFTPSAYHDPYGDLDPTTLSAAGANPQSTLAQLTLARDRGGADLGAALAGRGLLSSGAYTGGQQRLLEGFQGAQSSAEQSLLDALNGYSGSYASTMAEVARQRLAAEQQAALETAQQYPANWVNDPSGGTYDATSSYDPTAPYDQQPSSVQDALRLGYPIQPNGSVLASDVTTPEATPPGATFGNGSSLEHFGAAPPPSPAPSAPQLYYNPETGQYQTHPYVPGGSAWMT